LRETSLFLSAFFNQFLPGRQAMWSVIFLMNHPENKAEDFSVSRSTARSAGAGDHGTALCGSDDWFVPSPSVIL
jgi:hypothetical protein